MQEQEYLLMQHCARNARTGISVNAARCLKYKNRNICECCSVLGIFVVVILYYKCKEQEYYYQSISDCLVIGMQVARVFLTALC
jgi:hypothetical protein